MLELTNEYLGNRHRNQRECEGGSGSSRTRTQEASLLLFYLNNRAKTNSSSFKEEPKEK